MTISRKTDLACALLLVAAVFLYACTVAISLFSGPGYLAAVLVFALAPGLILRMPALFLSGTTAAAMSAMVYYMTVMTSRSPTEGLFIAGHMLSLPVMFVSACLTAWWVKLRSQPRRPWAIAGVGFLGTILGFTAFQLVIERL